jgi:hypothetical protein
MGTIIGITAAVNLHKEEVEPPLPALRDNLIYGAGRGQLVPHHPYTPPLAREAARQAEAETEKCLKDGRQT